MNNLATKTRKCLTTHPQAGLPHQCAATGPDLRGGGVHLASVSGCLNADGKSLASQSRNAASPNYLATKPPATRKAGLVSSVSPTDGRKRGTDFNEKSPGTIRFVCKCALDAVGLVVGLLLTFGMVVVAGAVMGVL